MHNLDHPNTRKKLMRILFYIQTIGCIEWIADFQCQNFEVLIKIHHDYSIQKENLKQSSKFIQLRR